tara:strand:- start:1014 stop:2024 length:1011 start_codon:yes stop_codon:yes gene_type:complete
MDLLAPIQLVSPHSASITAEGARASNATVERVPEVHSTNTSTALRDATSRTAGPDVIINISAEAERLSRQTGGHPASPQTNSRPSSGEPEAVSDNSAPDTEAPDSTETQGSRQENSVEPREDDSADADERREQQQQRQKDIENDIEQEQQRQIQEQVAELSSRDREVRAHELAHAAVGGQYAGSPSYEYQTGPDGQRYAVGGEVPIDASPVSGDPEATIRKMRIVQAAALAPAEPSEQDRRVAAMAARASAEASVQLATQRTESSSSTENESAEVQPTLRTNEQENEEVESTDGRDDDDDEEAFVGFQSINDDVLGRLLGEFQAPTNIGQTISEIA